MAKGIVATQRRHCGEEGSHLEGTGLPPDLGEGLRPLDEVRRVRQRDEAVHYGHQPIAEVARKLSQNDEPEEEVEGEGDCRDVADEGEELDLLLVKVIDDQLGQHVVVFVPCLFANLHLEPVVDGLICGTQYVVKFAALIWY